MTDEKKVIDEKPNDGCTVMGVSMANTQKKPRTLHEALYRVLDEKDDGTLYYDATFCAILNMTRVHGDDPELIAEAIYMLCKDRAVLTKKFEKIFME